MYYILPSFRVSYNHVSQRIISGAVSTVEVVTVGVADVCSVCNVLFGIFFRFDWTVYFVDIRCVFTVEVLCIVRMGFFWGGTDWKCEQQGRTVTANLVHRKTLNTTLVFNLFLFDSWLWKSLGILFFCVCVILCIYSI